MKLKTQLYKEAHTSHCASFIQCLMYSACVAKQPMSSHKGSKTVCVIFSQFFDDGISHLNQCFIQPPIRGTPENRHWQWKWRASISSKKDKKLDKESNPLADIGRDTEQAVQDKAIWIFDSETEQSCEQNDNHKAVLLIKNFYLRVMVAYQNFVQIFLVIWNV